MKPRSQEIVIVAVALTVFLLLLAVAVDAGRLYIERETLDRSAEAAADAGIGWVSDQMVTQAVIRQTEAAARPRCVPDGDFGSTGATCTASPQPADVPHWLTEEDRATLVSPGYQIAAEAVAADYARRNGIDHSSPGVQSLDFMYPYNYSANAPNLQFMVRVQRRVVVLLAGLLGRTSVDVAGQGLSELPQR